MWETYQHLPELINPIAFSIGLFSVKWYSIMYLVGFATVYFLLAYRIKKEERSLISKNNLQDLILYLIVGLLLGGRLGYVLFYNFGYYFQNPLEIILPFDSSCQMSMVNCYTGISGMSYHGGLIGIIIAGIIFASRKKLNFWKLADFVIPAIPAGYFFGRVGNFLNGELYGRATDMPWGMYFTDGMLRHPSQLYEAFFEGLILFIILWSLRNKLKVNGQLLIVYLVGYGFFRFFIEFFREPDPQMGLIFNHLTMGQALSIIMLISAIFCHFIVKRGKIVYTRD